MAGPGKLGGTGRLHFAGQISARLSLAGRPLTAPDTPPARPVDRKPPPLTTNSFPATDKLRPTKQTGRTDGLAPKRRSETALIYNDRAVLENFHISQAFALMRNEDCNILAALSKDEYR